jgi:hypothetical protein
VATIIILEYSNVTPLLDGARWVALRGGGPLGPVPALVRCRLFQDAK